MLSVGPGAGCPRLMGAMLQRWWEAQSPLRAPHNPGPAPAPAPALPGGNSQPASAIPWSLLKQVEVKVC